MDTDDVKVAINIAIGVAIILGASIFALVFIFWLPSIDTAATLSTTTTSSAPPATTVAPTTTTTAAPKTTSTTSTVMPVPERDATQVDHNPIAAAARVFVVGWLAPTSAEERRSWLEPVTSARLLPLVADIPAEVLPKGQPGDITVVYADVYRAVAHVTVDGVTAELTLVPGALSPAVPEAGGWRVSLLDKV